MNTWNYGNSGSMPVTIGHEHKFVGWNTGMDCSGTNFKPGDLMPKGKTENTVLYAQWEISKN